MATEVGRRSDRKAVWERNDGHEKSSGRDLSFSMRPSLCTGNDDNRVGIEGDTMRTIRFGKEQV